MEELKGSFSPMKAGILAGLGWKTQPLDVVGNGWETRISMVALAKLRNGLGTALLFILVICV